MPNTTAEWIKNITKECIGVRDKIDDSQEEMLDKIGRIKDLIKIII